RHGGEAPRPGARRLTRPHPPAGPSPTDPAGQAVRRRATARRRTPGPHGRGPGGGGTRDAPVASAGGRTAPPAPPRRDPRPRRRIRCPGSWTGVPRPGPAAPGPATPGPAAPGRVRRIRHTARQAPRLHTAHRTPTPAFGPQGEHRMSDTGTDTATTARARLADARLYLCTDARTRQGDLPQFLDAVLAGGVDIVQLRDKGMEAAEELEHLAVFAEACARHGKLLAVND